MYFKLGIDSFVIVNFLIVRELVIVSFSTISYIYFAENLEITI